MTPLSIAPRSHAGGHVGHAPARIASASSISSSRHEQRRGQADGVGTRRVHDEARAPAPRRPRPGAGAASSAAPRRRPAPRDTDAPRRGRPSPARSSAPAADGAAGHVLGLHDLQRGACGRRGEGLAAEGGAVVAGREGRRHLRPRPAGADGHAVAERLGHGDDVGLDARRAGSRTTARSGRDRSGSRPR